MTTTHFTVGEGPVCGNLGAKSLSPTASDVTCRQCCKSPAWLAKTRRQITDPLHWSPTTFTRSIQIRAGHIRSPY